MVTEVKFTMSVPAFDALRRIVQRDFMADQRENERIMKLPESERNGPIRETMRHESDRGLVERTLGFDSSKDEIGR